MLVPKYAHSVSKDTFWKRESVTDLFVLRGFLCLTREIRVWQSQNCVVHMIKKAIALLAVNLDTP